MKTMINEKMKIYKKYCILAFCIILLTVVYIFIKGENKMKYILTGKITVGGDVLPNRNFALCYIDLDNFKPVNDAYGHHAGDMLLKHISSILLNFVRDIDTVSRIGGDEFIILLKHIENEEHLKGILKRINELASDNPLHYSEDDSIEFSFSLGTSLFPKDAQSAINLLNVADKAMYKVKRQKNNN